MKKIAVGFVIFIVTLICIPLSFQVIYQAQSPETDFNPPQSLAITKEQNEEENQEEEGTNEQIVTVFREAKNESIELPLETYLIDRLLKAKEDIYLQVETNNDVSMKFHEKLGFLRGNDIISWYL